MLIPFSRRTSYALFALRHFHLGDLWGGVGRGKKEDPEKKPPIGKRPGPDGGQNSNADEVREAWQKAKATIGWIDKGQFGRWGFRAGTIGKKPGEVDVYVWRWKKDELAKLPETQEKFGLDLTNSEVDDGLKALDRFKQLVLLNLIGTKVSDKGLKEVASLKELQSLNLAGTNVTDWGLKELAALKQLRTLVLAHTKVTDGG